jgi:hypothetical protein
VRCLAALLLLFLSACDRGPPGTGGGGGEAGCCARKDASPSDTTPPHDVPRDAGAPSALWEPGAWHLPWREQSRPPPPACGPGEPYAAFVYDSNAGGFCSGEGWAAFGGFGSLAALRRGDPAFYGMASHDTDRMISLRCAARTMIAGVTDFRARRAALLRFTDPWSEGSVVWERPVERVGNSGVGIGWLAASDELVAFQFSSTFQQVFVGGPRGENMVVDPALNAALVGHTIEAFVADGPHLVLEAGGDVFLYTRHTGGTGTLQNLTPLPSLQSDPWVSGRYVVWLDERDGVIADGGRATDTEVYLYDIVTRAERRITHDPPDRPALQFDPRVEGDWVVWLDQRHAPQPALSPDIAPDVPREIYGFHIPTGREVPLVTGNNLVTGPMIADGTLWYNCTGGLRTPEQFEGIYRKPVPPAP